eukprot:ctg_100.g97
MGVTGATPAGRHRQTDTGNGESGAAASHTTQARCTPHASEVRNVGSPESRCGKDVQKRECCIVIGHWGNGVIVLHEQVEVVRCLERVAEERAGRRMGSRVGAENTATESIDPADAPEAGAL